MGAAKRAPRRRVTGAIVAAALAGGVAVGVVAASREPSIEAQRCAAGEAPTVAEAVAAAHGCDDDVVVTGALDPWTALVATPRGTLRQEVKSWAKRTASSAVSWVKRNSAEIVGGVAAGVTFAGCMAATAGAGSIGCGVAAGAVGGAVTNLWRSKVQKTQAFSWRSLAFDSVVGGASGLLGAGLGKAAAKFAAPAARRLGSSLSSAVKSVSAKTSSAAAPAARGAAKAGSAAKAKPSGSSPRVPEGAACRLSFSGDTRVLLASGASVRIDELKVGDAVMAADPQAGEKRGEQVEAVHEHQDALIVLVIDGAQLRTTEDHPFWSVSDQRYERADHLSPGELVLTSDGRTATVDAVVDDEPLLAPAYTLTVSDLHTGLPRVWLTPDL